MRIVYFYNEDWEQEFTKSKLSEHEFLFVRGAVHEHPEVSDATAEVLSLFVNSKIGATELDRFPSLKLVTARSTGFDHIDLAECTKRGITVCNVPTYGEHTVAEFAMALLLALSRRIYDAYKRLELTGSYAQDGLRGFDLKGRTIGIVGTGHIGEHMIRMAKGFAMNVVAYDVFPKPDLANSLGFTYVSLDELLAQSDVISLHAPYNTHTHHLINMENIMRVKRGCFLINTARGGLLETAALVRGLEEGIIAGAGLDVLEEEGVLGHEESLLIADHPNQESLRTMLANHYFIKHPRVIVTQHIAFNTQEAIERILHTTVENISGFSRGQVVNQVIAK